MSKKTISWLLLISLIINITVLITFSYYRWFHEPQERSKYHRSGFRERMHKRLKLTDEQEKQIGELRKQFFERIKPVREKIHSQRRILTNLIFEDSVDFNLITARLDSIKELERKIELESVKNLQKYREVLSPEQQAEFKKMITSRYQESDSRKKADSKGGMKNADSTACNSPEK